MTKILVLSDTHLVDGNLPSVIVNQAGKADMILHAGDFYSQKAYDSLYNLGKELHAVNGNGNNPNSPNETIKSKPDSKPLPLEKVIQKDGVRIGLVHGHNISGSSENGFQNAFVNLKEKANNVNNEGGVNVLVFGHIHHPLIALGERMLICPGSYTNPRDSYPTMIWLNTLKEKRTKIEASIIRLDSHGGEYKLDAVFWC